MPALFAVALFVSATLLFLVQPMIAKMILPKLGGTPAVWNTCMVFFQATLLAGYTYAHVTTTWLGVRRQALFHCILLATPLLVLPIAISQEWAPPADANPIPWVLLLLIVSAGLPFFLVSTSAPLLQKWFAATGHPSAEDPYFLYAASNVGSMLALIAYPALLEPNLRLEPQSRYWMIGYCVFAVLTIICAVALWRSHAGVRSQESGAKASGRSLTPDSCPLTLGRRLHWIALAFVPSSLMLGTTTYLSTDIAPIPLIWVVPLGLYLLSFILVFSRLPAFVHQTVIVILPVLVLLQVFLKYSGLGASLEALISVNLATLFFVAMACHGELARLRPPATYLTGYYLWMSLGGVLGGMFNALVAPMVFKDVTEYYLVLIFACFLLPRLDDKPAISDDTELSWFGRLKTAWSRTFVEPIGRLLPFSPRFRGWLLNLALPVLLGWGTYQFLSYLDTADGQMLTRDVFEWAHRHAEAWHVDDTVVTMNRVRTILQFGASLLICYVLVTHPVRFGLGVAAIMLANNSYLDTSGAYGNVAYHTRSFFGVLKVTTHVDDEDDSQGLHKLIHGTTLHGMQRTRSGAPLRNCEPMFCYHKTGPVGQLFDALSRTNDLRPMAVIGLGGGTLACYALPGQEIAFYEIDPEVVTLARDPRFFSNLADAEERGVRVSVQVGDARLSLLKVPDGKFRLIMVDAFSSDAIPVHLITREALQLYLRKLTPDGVIVFHISNRYLALEPVVTNLVEAEGLQGAIVMRREDDNGTESNGYTWVPVARHASDLGRLMYFTQDTDQTRVLDVVRVAGCTDSTLGQCLCLTQVLEARAGRPWYRLGDELHIQPGIDRRRVGVWTDDYSNVLSIFTAWYLPR